MMIQCEECELWRFIYSKYKLTASERAQLNDAHAEFTYTCSASLSDLDLSGRLAEVCIRNLHCYDPYTVVVLPVSPHKKVVIRNAPTVSPNL